MNKIFSIILICFSVSVFAQLRPKTKTLSKSETSQNDSTKTKFNKKKKKRELAKITQYLIISNQNDTTYVDTTLTIQKEYKFNYLRKDNFELLKFLNLGQTYNTLSQNFKSTNLMPKFGARAKHFNYMEVDDISYYHVPTPLTELMYKSAFEQGQLLDAFFTVNTTPQFNFSIAYKGLRSLGKYQNQLASTGNLRITTSYKTKNKRYFLNMHGVFQDMLNQENGGLPTESVAQFESGDNDYSDRGVITVNFQDAENKLEGKRFHANQTYYILQPDSMQSNQLNVKHQLTFRDKYYTYSQDAENAIFGDAFRSTNLSDRAELENFYNQLQLNYSNNTIGSLQFNASHNNYNYGYDKIVQVNNATIINRLKGNTFAVGGKYQKNFNKKLNIKGEAGLNISGDFDGNFINANAQYNITPSLNLNANFNHSSQAPNYNYQLYQSDYINYNWKNSLNNIKTQQLAFQLQHKKHGKLTVDATTINDYTYFALDPTTNFVKPFQNDKSITYLRVKLDNEIKFGKFALANTIMYQNVKDDNKVYNVPEFITRNTFYYSDLVFKKAMYLQTGITFNYFTKYNANAYDPVLGEFYPQNTQQIGGFPMLDFFINAKVRQTRIFLKAEHFNSHWTGYDYYSAPNYPYQDFIVRFGLVWNFFL